MMVDVTSKPADTPSTRWGDRENRRLDILRVGEELLTDGGLEALRMRDVAAGAGISPGAVYTYYRNKESLFAAIFAARLGRMLRDMEVALAGAADPVDAFVVAANLYRDGYLVFGRQFDALSLAGAEDIVSPEVADELRTATMRIVALFSSMLDKFGFDGDAPAAMTFLWSTVSGLANHYAGARQEVLTVPWDDAVRFAAEHLSVSLRLSSPR